MLNDKIKPLEPELLCTGACSQTQNNDNAQVRFLRLCLTGSRVNSEKRENIKGFQFTFLSLNAIRC